MALKDALDKGGASEDGAIAEITHTQADDPMERDFATVFQFGFDLCLGKATLSPARSGFATVAYFADLALIIEPQPIYPPCLGPVLFGIVPAHLRRVSQDPAESDPGPVVASLRQEA
jgi:hypothetical protein